MKYSLLTITMIVVLTGCISHQQPDRSTGNSTVQEQVTPTRETAHARGDFVISYNDDGSVNTDDWKTYKNDKYAFSVKHPASWYVDEGLKFDGTTTSIDFDDVKNDEIVVGGIMGFNSSESIDDLLASEPVESGREGLQELVGLEYTEFKNELIMDGRIYERFNEENQRLDKGYLIVTKDLMLALSSNREHSNSTSIDKIISSIINSLEIH